MWCLSVSLGMMCSGARPRCRRGQAALLRDDRALSVTRSPRPASAGARAALPRGCWRERCGPCRDTRVSSGPCFRFPGRVSRSGVAGSHHAGTPAVHSLRTLHAVSRGGCVPASSAQHGPFLRVLANTFYLYRLDSGHWDTREVTAHRGPSLRF